MADGDAGSRRVPTDVVQGWPLVPDGWTVVAVEAGIALGSLGLDERSYAIIRSAGETWSLRIDEHPGLDGWRTTFPDGSTEESTFTIPTEPIGVPEASLTGDRAFQEWVWEVHGATGRLLLWDAALSWWIVHDPDLEATLLSATQAQLVTLLPNEDVQDLAREPFAAWIPTLTESGRERAAQVAARFGLAPPGPA